MVNSSTLAFLVVSLSYFKVLLIAWLYCHGLPHTAKQTMHILCIFLARRIVYIRVRIAVLPIFTVGIWVTVLAGFSPVFHLTYKAMLLIYDVHVLHV